MRKINKIINIALIFILSGHVVCPKTGYALRPPLAYSGIAQGARRHHKATQALRDWAEEHKGEKIDKSQIELASQFGVSITTVFNVLREFGVISKSILPSKDWPEETRVARDKFILGELLSGKNNVFAIDYQKLYVLAQKHDVYLPLKRARKRMYLLFGFEVPKTEADELVITDEDLKKSLDQLRSKFHPDRVVGDKDKWILYDFWFKHINTAYVRLCKRRAFLKKTSGSYFPGIGRRRLSSSI